MKDLINRMINLDPSRRIRMKEVLVHPWISIPDNEVSFCCLTFGLVISYTPLSGGIQRRYSKPP